MARPPRIPVLLPAEMETVYFLTLCVQDRQPVLANATAWAALQQAAAATRGWRTLAMLAMPDHVHVLAAPDARDDPPSTYSRWLKHRVRRALEAHWKWQPGVFDHLLRGQESAQEKWLYIRENPVTAGLATHWRDWPYRSGFDDGAA